MNPPLPGIFIRTRLTWQAYFTISYYSYLLSSLALASAPDQMVQASARYSLAIGSSILLLPLFLARLADWFEIRSAYGLELVLLILSIGVAVWARKQMEGSRSFARLGSPKSI